MLKKQKTVRNKSKKTKKPTLKSLIKKLDAIFSKYIRIRDSSWGYITCISCWVKIPWKSAHNCHWIGRANYKYRRNEDNCAAWCSSCNVYRKEMHQRIFTLKQVEKLWFEKTKDYESEKRTINKLKVNELEEIIKYWQERLKDIAKERGVLL